MGLLFRLNSNLEMSDFFLEEGKPENPEKNPQNGTWPEYKIEPGPHWWEESTLTTAPSLLPLEFFSSVMNIRQKLVEKKKNTNKASLLVYYA